MDCGKGDGLDLFGTNVLEDVDKWKQSTSGGWSRGHFLPLSGRSLRTQYELLSKKGNKDGVLNEGTNVI
jgi:hypothetical protein